MAFVRPFDCLNQVSQIDENCLVECLDFFHGFFLNLFPYPYPYPFPYP